VYVFSAGTPVQKTNKLSTQQGVQERTDNGTQHIKIGKLRSEARRQQQQHTAIGESGQERQQMSVRQNRLQTDKYDNMNFHQ